MFKKILDFIKSSKKQFLFYSLIGSSAFVLDMSSMILLKEWINLRPFVAVIINQIFILNYVFFLNKHFSFKSKGKTITSMQRFYLLSAWNYIFVIVWMYSFTENWHFNYVIVRLVGVLIAVCWNFFLYKYWIYKVEPVFVTE